MKTLIYNIPIIFILLICCQSSKTGKEGTKEKKEDKVEIKDYKEIKDSERIKSRINLTYQLLNYSPCITCDYLVDPSRNAISVWTKGVDYRIHVKGDSIYQEVDKSNLPDGKREAFKEYILTKIIPNNVEFIRVDKDEKITIVGYSDDISIIRTNSKDSTFKPRSYRKYNDEWYYIIQ